jgi:hypothetical protein
MCSRRKRKRRMAHTYRCRTPYWIRMSRILGGIEEVALSKLAGQSVSSVFFMFMRAKGNTGSKPCHSCPLSAR